MRTDTLGKAPRRRRSHTLISFHLPLHLFPFILFRERLLDIILLHHRRGLRLSAPPSLWSSTINNATHCTLYQAGYRDVFNNVCFSAYAFDWTTLVWEREYLSMLAYLLRGDVFISETRLIHFVCTLDHSDTRYDFAHCEKCVQSIGLEFSSWLSNQTTHSGVVTGRQICWLALLTRLLP